MTSRTEQRAGIGVNQRVQLLENDVDDNEVKMQKMDARLGKIMAICLSILASLVVASIMLALNLAAGK